MALTGKAFLGIWHDVEPAFWDEYMEWHTREHMPERLSVPGFTIGKRMINHDVPRYRYGSVYAGESVETFRSPAYLERLNNPSDWTNKVQPNFRNFLRVACDRIASAGVGDGGAMATIRLDFADGSGADQVKAGAQALADALLKVTGACCVNIGLARTDVSGVKTRETELRPGKTEKEFDVVVLIEGSGAPELEASLPAFQAVVAESGIGVTDPQTIVYNLSYQLTSADMAAAGGAQ